MSAPPPPPTSMLDTECYVNYWLCMFESGDDVEMYNGWHYVNGQPCDQAEFLRVLAALLRRYRVVTFNGQNYDMPLITLALMGKTTAELKQWSDAIIVRGLKPWDVADVPEWIDHIDLFDVAPGQGSQKAYAGKMHSRRIQDLPIDPAATIDDAARLKLRDYCRVGDLVALRDLWNNMQSQIALRIDMGRQYGLDLRSKSDAQIAEAVMKRILPFKVQKPQVPYRSQFYYRPPPWLRFIDLKLLELLARSPFTINDNGSPMMTDELAGTLIRIGDSAYQMGSGGLHSTESKVMHVADAAHEISDHDVASYYPSLILLTGIYPHQIGEHFAKIYRDWYTRRLAAKRAGQKKDANSLKTLLNGTFGKLGSPWSIFYAPSEMIQVTITGQLALLMLIELLEAAGVRVISANTDGIVLKTPRALTWLRDAIIAGWEQQTGLETEANAYRLLASRDVNSYVAIKPDGEVKTKGAFAPPEPGPSGWPNPTGQIAVDAAVAWLRDGTPVEQTVRACTDVRQFVHVRQVKGGGSFCPGGNLPKRTTQKAMREVVGDLPKLELLAAYDQACERNAADRQYLGKVVRWYFGAGSRGCIVTPAGGLVARTDGARPLMEMNGSLPADIDYDWYMREAESLLVDMGAK